MKVTRDDLKQAAQNGVISADQAESLWQALRRQNADQPKFDLAHFAYYFGALIAMSAMGWFMTLGWQRYGGTGIFLISLSYGILFLLAGRTLWYKEGLIVPGGLLFTLAVWMTPLVIYGLQTMTGLWPQDYPGAYRDYYSWVKGSWSVMEVGTIIAGVVALKFIRFPFLTFPIAFSLWFMSMDITPLLFGKDAFAWDERLWVSLLFGLAMIIVSFLVDLSRTKEDFAFWGYLFGLAAFWGGLTMMESGSEFKKLLYCLINMGLMLVSVALKRQVFMVFGAMGVFGYLSHLAYGIFADSMLFPVVLVLIGIAFIYAGVQYHRHRSVIESRVNGFFLRHSE